MDRNKGRKDCYFGFHLALHPHQRDAMIDDPRGKKFYEQFLDITRPDYIQIDAKSWHGISAVELPGIPSANSQILKDTQRWMQEAEKRGILVYGEYCFLSDTAMLIEHPDWAAVDENGKPYQGSPERNPDERIPLSIFSPYFEKCVLPELKAYAMSGKYRGMWVDFGRWFMKPDYSVWARKAYQEAGYGDKLPCHDDPKFSEFCLFQYDYYTKASKRYVKEIHSLVPDFEICDSKTYMWNELKKDDAGMDFFSTDLAYSNFFLRARMKSRMLMNQNVPWDVMDWDHCFNDKTPYSAVGRCAEHFCQNAAAAIACGGGYSIYGWPYRFIDSDGTRYTAPALAAEWAMYEWAKVRDFCKSRQSFSYHAKNVPQTAVLLANQAVRYGRKQMDYNGEENYHTLAGCGLLAAFLDNQYSTTFLFEDGLGEIDKYGVIAIPEAYELTTETIDKLLRYTEKGGRLLIASPLTLNLFKLEELEAIDRKEKITLIVKGKKCTAGIDTGFSKLIYKNAQVRVSGLGKTMEGFKEGPDSWEEIAVEMSYGKGKICALAFDFGTAYTRSLSPALKQFFSLQIESLFPDAMFQVKGSSYVDTQLMTKDGKLILHLINCAGDCKSTTIRTYDEIPQLSDLYVSIRSERKPRSVYLEPEHIAASFSYENQIIELKIDKLEIHTAVVVSY